MLKEEQVGAIGRFVLAGKEKLCLIRPKGDALVLETLFVAEDVYSQAEIDEAADETTVKKAELDLARQLVDSLVGEFEPTEQLTSEYRQDLREMLEAKLAGQPIAEPEEVEDAPVIDLMEALKKSVAEAKERKAPEKTAAAKRAREARSRRQEVSSALAAQCSDRRARRSPEAVPGRGSCRSCPGRSGRLPARRRGSPPARSIPSSFDSSSGVRWFGMTLLPRERKNPPARRRATGSVEAFRLVVAGDQRSRSSGTMHDHTENTPAGPTAASNRVRQLDELPLEVEVLGELCRRAPGRRAARSRSGRRRRS